MMLEDSLILSVICLVGIKPVWSGEIMEVIIVESLWAKMHPKIFRSVLMTEIGL